MIIDVTILSTRWTASGMFRSVQRVYDNQKSYSMGHAGAALGLLEGVIDDKPAILYVYVLLPQENILFSSRSQFRCAQGQQGQARAIQVYLIGPRLVPQVYIE